MSWKLLPIKCPKCKHKRDFIIPNGYWCEVCERMTYAPIMPLSYDDGGEG